MSVHDWLYIENSPGFAPLIEIVVNAVGDATEQELVREGLYFFMSGGQPCSITQALFRPHHAFVLTEPGHGQRLFDLIAAANATLELRLATDTDDKTLAYRPAHVSA